MQRMPDIGLKNLLAQDYANDDIPFNDFTPVSSFASKNDYQSKNGVWRLPRREFSWFMVINAGCIHFVFGSSLLVEQELHFLVGIENMDSFRPGSFS